jgi:hypothetical protein
MLAYFFLYMAAAFGLIHGCCDHSVHMHVTTAQRPPAYRMKQQECVQPCASSICTSCTTSLQSYVQQQLLRALLSHEMLHVADGDAL